MNCISQYHDGKEEFVGDNTNKGGVTTPTKAENVLVLSPTKIEIDKKFAGKH